MKSRDLQGLIAKARNPGRGFDGTAFGEAVLTEEPIEVSGEAMVGKSVRVPLATAERIIALAAAQGTTWSDLVRRWIEEGLLRASEPIDPEFELAQAVSMIEHVRLRLQERAA